MSRDGGRDRRRPAGGSSGLGVMLSPCELVSFVYSLSVLDTVTKCTSRPRERGVLMRVQQDIECLGNDRRRLADHDAEPTGEHAGVGGPQVDGQLVREAGKHGVEHEDSSDGTTTSR